MSLRRIVSLFLLLVTVFLLVTSVILYVMPHGRVAYWAGWSMWGLSKDQWTDLHMDLGLFLLIAAVFHVVYNWRPILTYLKSRDRRRVVFNRNFAVALGLTLAVLVGTLLQVPPFRWISDLNAVAKDAASARYGEPPYGHAELSPLPSLAGRLGFELEPALERLRAAGFRAVDPEANLLTIARANGGTPQALFEVIVAGGEENATHGGGEARPPAAGLGRMRLAEICARGGYDPQAAVARLAAAGIVAEPGQRLRDIAGRNGMTPGEVLKVLQSR